MSFSLSKIFGGQPAAQPQVAQPGQAQQVPGNNPMNNPAPPAPLQTNQTAPNGVVPADGQQAGAAPTPPPMDQFKNLWDPKPVDANDPASVQVTSDQLMEAAGKVDFRQIVNQDIMAKINAGGPEAMTAMLEAMNKMQQTTFGQSMAAAQKLVAREVSAAEAKFSKQVPQVLKRQNVQEHLISQNPALAHPTVAPILAAVQSQLSEKYPNATEAELRSTAETLVSQMGEAFKPTPKKEEAKVPTDQDWTDLA